MHTFLKELGESHDINDLQVAQVSSSQLSVNADVARTLVELPAELTSIMHETIQVLTATDKELVLEKAARMYQ